MYSVSTGFVVSEVEKVDEVLWGERHSAALWIVGCAGVVCVLKRNHSY